MINQRIIPGHEIGGPVSHTIAINGQAIGLSYKVFSIAVSHEVNKIPFARVSIFDGDPAKSDFQVSNDDLFRPGNKIQIAAGYGQSSVQLLFSGIITKIGLKMNRHRYASFEVECKSEVVKLCKSERYRYFYNRSDKEIMEDILDEAGLSHRIEQPDPDYVHSDLMQYQLSDWDFILARARANGQLAMVFDEEVIVQRPDFDQPVALRPLYGANLLEFEGEIDATDQFAHIEARAWDYSKQEMAAKEARETIPDSPGNLSSQALAGVLSIPEKTLRHSGARPDEELENQANGEMMRHRISKARGRIQIKGVANILPGQLIELNGLGDRFNGPVYVTAVHHHIADGRWRTGLGLGLRKPLLPKMIDTEYMDQPWARGLAIGKVSQLEEGPGGEYRILARLPMVDDEAPGVWARMASLDAGENRGAFFLPEIDDEVVIGFINGDPRDAVILGMLNSQALPAPLLVADNNPQKGFITRSQMKMIWDDEQRSLTINTPEGNEIRLDEQTAAIHINDQHGNRILLGEEGVTIQSTGNLLLEADGNIQLSGNEIEEITN